MELTREQFEDAVAREYPYMLRLVAARVRNEATAEDIVHSALADLWERRENFRGECPINGWMMRAVIIKMLETQRTASRRREIIETEWAEPAVDYAMPDDHDLARDLERAIADMQPDEQLALRLRLLEDWPWKDIHKATGLSRFVVCRLRRIVRKRLGEYAR